jgi:uncharacterized protein YmfQ (DUF2313 family)
MTTKDRHIRRTGDDYAEALAALLPTGPAWPREGDSVLMALTGGLAQIWGAPVDARAADLLERESDPRKTIELLPDWERNWGLPNPCYKAPTGIGERQAALVYKMTTLGGQSREFMIEAAAYIGYEISITEYRPFMVGIDRVGDNRTINADGSYSDYPYILGPPENRFYWSVHVDTAKLIWFRVTAGQCGIDPHLRIGLADDLECLLNQIKPAHTEIIFDYSGLQPQGPMAGTP